MTPDNLESVAILLANIDRYFKDDPRFSIFIKEIGGYGSMNEKMKTLDSNTAKVIKNTIRQHRSEEVDENPHICYASKANSFVIRSNGRINKCTVALSNINNDVGHLESDGTMNLKSDMLKKWMGGFYFKDLSLISCPASAALK